MGRYTLRTNGWVVFAYGVVALAWAGCGKDKPAPVCGDGVVNAGEQCDGGACCDASCQFLTTAARCRPSPSECDPAEYCTGEAAACPVDVTVRVGGICTTPGSLGEHDGMCAESGECLAVCGDGIVSPSEDCDGNVCCDDTCHFAVAVECRASQGLCDPVEVCDGVSAECPADALDTGSVCRVAADGCDAAEVCDGASAACPEDVRKLAGDACTVADSAYQDDGLCQDGGECLAVCGDGVVSPSEDCESGLCCGGDCHFAATTVQCRFSQGDCDPAEYCGGATAQCPDDTLSTGTVCRAIAGSCDVVETCNGVDPTCPTDEWQTAGSSCDYCVGTDCYTDGTCQTDQLCLPPGSTAVVAQERLLADQSTAGNADDAQEYVSNHTVNTSRTVVSLGKTAAGNSDVYSAVRFVDVQVPPGAMIIGAYVQYVAESSGSASTPATVKLETSDSAAAMTATNYNITSRSFTSEIAWDIQAWSAAGDAGAAQRTPDLSALVQQLVMRPGWTAGNAILVVTHAATGVRSAYAADSGQGQEMLPSLHIVYHPFAAANCGNGVLDFGETCDNPTSPCCSTYCLLPTASVVCRPAADVCDVAESCVGVNDNGLNAVCPDDATATASTECRAVAGDCDAAELCDGTNVACPTDVFLDGSTVCRVATAECDAIETCNGSGVDCPADGLIPDDTECTGSCADDSPCTSSTPCADLSTCAIRVCQAGWCATETCGNATIEAGEDCDGGACCAPDCRFRSSASTCRAAADVCDAAELCTGSSADCPADLVQENTVACHAVAGICDTAETCDGVNPTCPTDQFLNSSTECRAAGGDDYPCDQAVLCSGSAAACAAADNFLASTTACTLHSESGACDTKGNCVVTGTMPVFERTVSLSNYDAEESTATGAVVLTSNVLYLGHKPGGDDQLVGIRYKVNITNTRTIKHAYLQFTAHDTVSPANFTGTASLTIQGQAIDSAAAFSTTANDISSRARTTASVSWSPMDWMAEGDSKMAERTSELKTIIQEIVSRPGWVSDSYLVLIISGTGTRAAYSRDGSSTSTPTLHIEYQ